MIRFTSVKGHSDCCVEEWTPEEQAYEGDQEATATPRQKMTPGIAEAVETAKSNRIRNRD